jgi:hypothetical protein
MSITTLDGIIAGRLPSSPFIKVAPGTPIIGTIYSLWLGAGSPGAGVTIPTGNKSGQFYTCAAAQIAGQLPFTNPPAGDTMYLARFAANANTIGTLILADRIWADSLSPVGIGAQLIYSGSFPRSAGIGGGDSSGTGIMLGLEVFTQLGAAAATPKVTYVNSAGTAGDTGVATMAMPASAAVGTFIPIGLKSGAFGVRSVTAYNNMTTKTSGCLGLVAYRPIVRIGVAVAGLEDAVDAITSGFPIFYPNMVPMLLWVAGSTTAPTVFGGLDYCMG